MLNASNSPASDLQCILAFVGSTKPTPRRGCVSKGQAHEHSRTNHIAQGNKVLPTLFPATFSTVSYNLWRDIGRNEQPELKFIF
jgi:hypothetical protein